MSPEFDATETSLTVTCPVCQCDIPCPTTSEPNENGLTVTLDRSWAEEHMAMHQKCTCKWVSRASDGAVRRITSLNCEVHA